MMQKRSGAAVQVPTRENDKPLIGDVSVNAAARARCGTKKDNSR